MRLASNVSVLIAGAGPFGLMLAVELGRRGVETIVIDQKSEMTVNPRANATQARTMEYFRRLGFSHEIRALGLPSDYPTDIAYFTRYSGFELARFRLPSSRDAGSVARTSTGSWSTPELPHRVSQKFVEHVLQRHARQPSCNTLLYGWRLKHFVDDGDAVSATIGSVSTGEQRTVTIDYLIGADGANSTVRRALDIRYSGESGIPRDFFGGSMLAVYFRAPDFYKVVPHSPAWMYWSLNSQRRGWLASVDGAGEFVFHTQLKPTEVDTPIGLALARDLFRQAMGVEIDMEIIDVDKWVAGHALVADRFGSGRVFIGGDAAHLFTPAGGLGYNTAIEDAVNLAWKLEAVVKGVAEPALLATYASERRKVAIRNTGYARAFANEIGNYIPDPQLEQDGAEGEAARERAGMFLNQYIRREFNIPGVTFGTRYDGSAAIVADGSSSIEDTANQYVPSASPGGRPPHVWLNDGSSLYDAFGLDWTLLTTLPDEAKSSRVQTFLQAAAKCGLNVKPVEVSSPHVRDLYNADFVLIRPDQIIAWRGAANDLNAERLFGLLLGQTQMFDRTSIGEAD